jgi:hypothetical protein
LPDNLSLDESLTWISSNAVEGGDYFIVLKNDETIDPRSLYNNYGYGQINITLTGDTAERTVSLNTTGSLFTVGSGVTLTLGNNVTLLGRSDNYSPLVTVDWIGALIMNSGSKITGNTNNSWSSGGGVNVFGTFTMNGGEITGNRVEYGGGGVYVPGGTFIKQAEAVIYGSNADASLKNTAVSGGGHAAYVAISPEKTRNTTASAGVTLDSSLSGVTGGWVDAEITAFNIGAVVGTFNGTNITLVISYSNSSEISSLMPTITLSLGAAVSPASLEAQNFSSAVQYTVTAEDGSILVYTVTIKNSRARLMSFNFSEPAATGIIDEGAKTISVTVPYNTDPGTLVPEITLSPNATVNPASGEARNFSSPAAYTVTAEDGTVMVYTVTVTPKGQGSVTLVYPDDAAGGDLALTGIVISKPGGKETLQASGEFDSYRWRVDGVIRWNGKSFTLDADHYTIGGHRISLEVTRGGVAYSKSGSFIVQ